VLGLRLDLGIIGMKPRHHDLTIMRFSTSNW
jgi:hypothetical protein